MGSQSAFGDVMQTERERLSQQLGELKTRRSTYETQWREVMDQIVPYRARWATDDYNRGQALTSTLVNSTPTRSLRILAAGLMAGITSPSRPWFKLTVADDALLEVHAVSQYLATCERVMRKVLLKSRWYQSLADGGYRDLGQIATAVIMCDEDPELFVRFRPLPVGEWFLDVNHLGVVDTLFREFPYTVRQMEQAFGREVLSPEARHAFDQGNYGAKFEIVHAIYPNNQWMPERSDIQGKRWLSKWWEKKAPIQQTQYLREAGYEEFPVLAPRWNSRGSEVYGIGCPGWESVGDCKGLQHCEKELARLIDKASRPPMLATPDVRNRRASLLPGDITYVDKDGGEFRPAVQIQPGSIQAMLEHIRRHEQRIQQAFYVDLWLALISDQRAERPTATEVEYAQNEKMLQLGPLLENLNDDLLDPAIERVYRVLQRRGQLPDPPDELEGVDLEVQYISILHQAQKLTSISGIRELVGFAQQLVAAGKPDAMDKIDSDAVMDELTDILGVRPELVLSDDQVTEVRAAKAQRQQAQDQGASMLAATEGARNLSQVEPQKLGELANMVSGAAAAQGGLQ